MTQSEPQPNITINVNVQRDGYIFGLHPRSRIWLETTYPTRQRVLRVFIGLEKRGDFRQIPESILSQVLKLITGLSLDELKASGGFRLYNPMTREEVLNPPLVYV